MKTLGIVLAGGQSSRFGPDKAEAIWRGRSLIHHTATELARCCDSIAIAGRSWGGLLALEDWPRSGLGPLGGVASALRYAGSHGFDEVLSVPVDCVSLPRTLRHSLLTSPSYLEVQPVIGLWPVAALSVLERILQSGGRRSLHAFARGINARSVSIDDDIPNINTPQDLADLNAANLYS